MIKKRNAAHRRALGTAADPIIIISLHALRSSLIINGTGRDARVGYGSVLRCHRPLLPRWAAALRG